MDRHNVGILIFDGVEVLDFAGPFEVFSRTRLVPGPESRRSDESAPFNVFTVARARGEISATGGLRVVPEYGVDDAPQIDILLIPGGFGTRALLEDAETERWIRRVARSARRVTSVCTGALLLAQAGLLDGRRATTHHAAIELMRRMFPAVTVVADRRFVDDGVVTSAGVAAGIDMSFHIVEACCGDEVADETAAYIEYERHRADEPL